MKTIISVLFIVLVCTSTRVFASQEAFFQLQVTEGTKIVENVTAGVTLGGIGNFTSLMEIPYISEIGFASLSKDTKPTQAVKTDTVKEGIKCVLNPAAELDKYGKLPVNVKLSMTEIVKWIKLDAGSQIGTFSQPKIENFLYDGIFFLAKGETTPSIKISLNKDRSFTLKLVSIVTH